MEVSAGTLPRDHRTRCREQDLHVVPERAIAHVSKVEAHHFVERRAAASLHLPQSGDARLGLKYPTAVPGLVLVHLVLEWRARADERHRSAQHVPELRQLVEARLPKETPDWGNPWVVGQLEDGSPIGGRTRHGLRTALDE